MQFANRLEMLLEKNSVSRYKLAKEIGCTVTTVTNWINGKSIPSSDRLQMIAGYFGVSTDYLMGSDDTDTAENDEMAELLEEIRKNPELRTLFSISKRATPEEVRQYIRLIKALRGEE